MSFNPHTHAGCDCCQGFWRLHVLCFNPHTHAGCDRFCEHIDIRGFCFNPHTHAGCDYIRGSKMLSSNVSIHTPTQGVTYI